MQGITSDSSNKSIAKRTERRAMITAIILVVPASAIALAVPPSPGMSLVKTGLTCYFVICLLFSFPIFPGLLLMFFPSMRTTAVGLTMWGAFFGMLAFGALALASFIP